MMGESDLRGKTIVSARRMTDDEMDEMMWANGRHANPPVLEFDDGSILFPTRDPEMNGPGAMFLQEHGGHELEFVMPDENND